MIKRLYSRYWGRFIFRKLNLSIGVSMLAVFIMLGYLTYNSFYRLLEDREQELLNMRTENLKLNLAGMIDQFKRETVSIYKDPTTDQPIPTNEYFMSGEFPSADDERGQLLEKQYFNGVISMMLNRNPDAISFLFYRAADHKVFAQTQRQQLNVDYSFDYPSFFDALPRDYSYPFIGNVDGLLNASGPMVYFANPVFDLLSIHPNQVHGYFLMIIDPAVLTDKFNSGDHSGRRLSIMHDDRLLFSDASEGSIDALPRKDSLFSLVSLQAYNMDILGFQSKAAIQSRLHNITLFIILILGISWPVCLLLIFSIQTIILKRLKMMMQHFKIVQANPFSEPMPVQGNDEISELMVRFNRMTENLKQYINRVYIADIQKRNAEFVALKMQINPHFLFNTLESLRMQAIAVRQRVLADKLYSLGTLFRWMLKQTQEVIPIREELQHMEYYLDLFNMGKSNTIQLEIESGLDLDRYCMLKFSLQPIIENAILHGELEKRDEPKISLRIDLAGEHLSIDICDNGKGISPDRKAGLIRALAAERNSQELHHGLSNVNERIKIFFGEEYGLHLSIDGPVSNEGFCLNMTIPITLTEQG
ncbi:MAG: histidine kinase [Paenibacillaceae bacterium]|nr:histidine kinase [Paenibacillaceae bacterium]